MTWLFAILLAAFAFALIVFVFKAPRSGWEAVGAALLVGIAGYGMQASPDQPGAPKAAVQQIADDPEAVVEARGDLVEQNLGQPKDRNLVIADAFARNGQFANAAGVLRGAVEQNPNDFEAWLALGNALLAHSEGFLTPATIYAYGQAQRVDPEHPGPAFFLGMGLAQSGQFAEARETWADLLARSGADAPWRADLEMRLARLDQLMAAQAAAQAGR